MGPGRSDAPAGASPSRHVVARIGKPHGLHGEVTVELRSDDPHGRLVAGATFQTQAAPGSGVPRSLTLETARLHREIWLLRFAGVPDRTGAEGLRGTLLLLEGDAADGAGEDEEGWYEEDLVGLRAVDAGGATLGEVVGLDLGAAQDRLVLRLPGGGEALVPFVEAIVPEVDPEAGTVTISAPPGLLDLAGG